MQTTLSIHRMYLLIVFFISAILFGSSLSSALTCNDTERNALLGFKQGLTDPSGRLSSWVGKNCCQWDGVSCHNGSGHVIKLDLRNKFPSTDDFTAYNLGGRMNAALVDLENLEYLDLSMNDFEGIQIPEFFGSLKNLRYLNLSSSSFGGNIPPHLGNLSNLNFLDLYSTSLGNPLRAKDLEWLSGLSSLKLLNLGQVELTDIGAEWLQAVNMLPSLVELHLPWCEIQTLPLNLPFLNFSSLQVLDLSQNSFNLSIPNWIFNITSLTLLDLGNCLLSGAIPAELVNLVSLEYLDLSGNQIEGQLPGFIGKLCNLKTLDLSMNNFMGETHDFFGGFAGCHKNSLVSLDLSGNKLVGELRDSLGILENLQQLQLDSNSFWGSIPASIGSLASLQTLDLSFNNMNGTIPESFGQLSKLTDLYLEDNPWAGVVTETQLMNLSSLQNAILITETIMSLVFNVTTEWVPPFRLITLHLQNCLVGPRFPTWLRVQSELASITLKNVGIEDAIPQDWISKIAPQLTYLDLSNNQMKGKLPGELKSPKLTAAIDLSYNRFEGSVPIWSTNASHFYLQSNSFSGSIPTNIDELMPQLKYMFLSDNQLNGVIPSTICTMMNLEVLSIRNNLLSGEIPRCWNESHLLWVMDVSNNNLSGNIPSSIGLLTSLTIFMMSNNSLVGEIPPSLQNCSLMSIDLGDNRLSGTLPRWIGETNTYFWMIRLRSNSFTGTISNQWCDLQVLHILDLADNNLSGVIPPCLGNLTSLTSDSGTVRSDFFRIHQYYYEEQTILVAKGQELEYGSTLEYVNIIDLSRNSLTGGIPEGVTNLTELGTLNLSMNHLTGTIPREIGKNRWLETLDLSNNNLSGPIPESISLLTSLSHLNLSHNSLNGRIPSGSQLQTLNDASIYAGNPSLCGAPTATKCPGDDELLKDKPPASQVGVDDNDTKDDFELLWFFAGMGSGYITGLTVVCCTLWMIAPWRNKVFRFFRVR